MPAPFLQFRNENVSIVRASPSRREERKETVRDSNEQKKVLTKTMSCGNIYFGFRKSLCQRQQVRNARKGFVPPAEAQRKVILFCSPLRLAQGFSFTPSH
jgi:hypothetical protein